MTPTLVASVQEIDARGAINPIERAGDVIEVEAATASGLGGALAQVLAEHPEVECFDVTITRRAP